MVNRLSFSGQNLTPKQTATYYNDVEGALKLYFSEQSPSYQTRFVGERPSDVRAELQQRISELDRSSAMNLLASIEASFRVDYLQRCYRRERDEVSRAFRNLHKERGTRVSLEEEIFEIWKTNTTGSKMIIGDLRSAFKFRHWMAHGRYWKPKHSGKFDYVTIYNLSVRAAAAFPLIT